MNAEDLAELFLSKIKPFEDRIHKLEEAEKSKELEIVTLKHAIQNLHRIIETLRSQVKRQGNPAQGGGAKAMASPNAKR